MPLPANEPTAPHAAAAALYRQDISGCLEAAIGRHGLSDDELARWLERIGPFVERLATAHRAGTLPLLGIAAARDDIFEADAALDRLSQGARLILFFGTGGSGLGGQTLAQIAGWNIPGGAKSYQRQRPRTRFYDNLDAETLAGALDGLDLHTTRFVFISKSGGTSETLAQAIVTLTMLREAGLEARLPELCLGLTEPATAGKSNGLRDLLGRFGIPMLDHHTGIGGRFSCLTNVGLLPARARGLDVHAIRAGAQVVIEGLHVPNAAASFAPAIGAATAIALAKEKGVRISVLMPYADRLARLADWYAQLWAESLGKSGEGTCPLGALGPLDQHSQLQLFMDGPREIEITIMRVASRGAGPRIAPELATVAGAGFMGGRSVGDVVDAQAHAVAAALAKAGRPVRTFDLAKLDERTTGAILMHFMMETILAGWLIGVDPFDQPAVELAKVLTKERLAAQ